MCASPHAVPPHTQTVSETFVERTPLLIGLTSTNVTARNTARPKDRHRWGLEHREERDAVASDRQLRKDIVDLVAERHGINTAVGV